MELSRSETRVLGSLMEKERTTPENYPLSLNALANACNQATNREPVMMLGDREIEEALDSLRRQKLATVIFGGGSRVQKYRHTLPEIYNFTPQESALLCVLLLRGPQTPGELRQRAERLAPFASLAEVETVLEAMAGGPEPFVRSLPARPGQKERRFVQLLSGEPVEAPITSMASATNPSTPAAASQNSPDARSSERLEALESEVATLRHELGELRENVNDLRRQLGA